jgi:hypothetical protein
VAGAAAIPLPTARPGSATFADYYGGQLGYTTSIAGSGGAGRVEEVARGLDRGNPLAGVTLGPDFLRQPAGWVLIAVVLLILLSIVDGGD